MVFVMAHCCIILTLWDGTDIGENQWQVIKQLEALYMGLQSGSVRLCLTQYSPDMHKRDSGLDRHHGLLISFAEPRRLLETTLTCYQLNPKGQTMNLKSANGIWILNVLLKCRRQTDVHFIQASLCQFASHINSLFACCGNERNIWCVNTS